MKKILSFLTFGKQTGSFQLFYLASLFLDCLLGNEHTYNQYQSLRNEYIKHKRALYENKAGSSSILLGTNHGTPLLNENLSPETSEIPLISTSPKYVNSESIDSQN